MLLLIIIVALFLPVLYVLYFSVVMHWQREQTRGDRYFSRKLADRRAYERRLHLHAALLMPPLNWLRPGRRTRRFPFFRYKEVACVNGLASAESFAAAEHYSASNKDIFVAAQMKCGTTWMQQIVFEILHHGAGDLTDNGYRHMYALSPWIETSPRASVALEKAPLVSRYRKRLIKTHLPTQLCPYSPDAKYIYVARHPVSCFASCKDFIAMLGGPFCPTEKNLVDWFCSNDMWWSPWPAHVAGWWGKSRQVDNILFVTFEQMKDDLDGVVQQVANFLGITLSETERTEVVRKSSFAYMSEHEEQFAMSPPSIFSVSNELRFMQTGKKQRDSSLDEATKQHIMAYCREQMKNQEFPFNTYYPV